MNFEWDGLIAVVILAWGLVLPFDSLVAIALAALVFFSKSIPVCILFLLSLNLLALIQATLGGKKSLRGRTQKRYMLVFFGNLCALMGSTLSASSALAYPLIFFGLLLTISNAVSSALFYAHLESLSLKAFLQSVAIPSFVAIDILLKVKANVKSDYTQLWDVTLLILGLSSFLISSLLALSKRRLKDLLIYWSQAWIGLLLFLLVVDGPYSLLAFSACAITAVSSAMLLSAGVGLGGRYFSFAKIVSLGFPGTVVFSALFFTLKSTISLSMVWLLLIGIGYMIQSIAILGARSAEVPQTARLKFRFWLITATQVSSGIFLLWMDKGFMK